MGLRVLIIIFEKNRPNEKIEIMTSVQPMRDESHQEYLKKYLSGPDDKNKKRKKEKESRKKTNSKLKIKDKFDIGRIKIIDNEVSVAAAAVDASSDEDGPTFAIVKGVQQQ